MLPPQTWCKPGVYITKFENPETNFDLEGMDDSEEFLDEDPEVMVKAETEKESMGSIEDGPRLSKAS